MLTLGIETSCDETAAAVVRDGREVLSSVVASQADLHARFGGVVPEVASRRHMELICPVVEQALAEAEVGFEQADAIAVTQGPGLIGSLLVGMSAAKSYARALGKPLVAVNHVEGHVYANYLDGEGPVCPAVCLVASGGHSDIVLIQRPGSYKILGWTRDDAAGEALDKVARLLGLGWPGGPAIEACAQEGNAQAISFPRVSFPDSFDFSFSGPKTAVARLWETRAEGGGPRVPDIAASFQAAVVEVLAEHTREAAKWAGAAELLLAGGVAANALLRERAAEAAAQLGIPFRCPPARLCTDNAAMIAAAGHHILRRRGPDRLDADTFSTLPLAEHI
ncbi:MAG: tRNA (adenosine(37)-N6)-threonylcarbamoyltransferase complex transferase subunit TsaD [Armatimonadota bacterium]